MSSDRTTLSVDNGVSSTPPREGDGRRPRDSKGCESGSSAAGGTMSAGPTADGWRVEIEVPA